MWPFKKTIEKKESAVTPLIVMDVAGQPVWTEIDYEKLSKEGYQKNIIAYRAIDDISKSAASVPWKLFRRTPSGKEEVLQHDILTLLQRPNPRQGLTFLVYEIIAYLQISGNSYIEGVTAGNNNNTASPPLELWCKRPDRIKIIPGKNLVEAFEYDMNGRKYRWPVDTITGKTNLLHLPLFHPTDDFYGFSPIMAAAQNVDIHNTSNAWNMKLLQNDAKPSGILISEKSIDAQQLRRIKAEMRKKWSGPENAGKPVLLEGGAWKWMQTSMSPHDMDWLNSQNTSARDICHAFGYPPFLLGLPGNSTFNNMEMAKLWLWENTVLFYLNFLRDEFNVWLMPRYDDGENLFLDYDLSAVPALASRRDALWDKAEKGKDILSINERRAIVGYAPIGDEGDDIYIPISSMPLSQAGDFDDEKSEFKKALTSEGYANEKAEELAKVLYDNND